MKQTGLLAVILSFVFALVVAVLGFLQPEYSHVVNSISTLVVGPHGWVGQVNFVVLALAGLMVGLGLGSSVYGERFNPISLGFGLASLLVLNLMFFKTERHVAVWSNFGGSSLGGQIHYGLTILLLLVLAWCFYLVIRGVSGHEYWKPIRNHTWFVLVLDFFLGVFWFAAVGMDRLQGVRGLYQKILVVNLLVWMVRVGWRVWREEEVDGELVG